MGNTTNLCTFVINKVIFISCTYSCTCIISTLCPPSFAPESVNEKIGQSVSRAIGICPSRIVFRVARTNLLDISVLLIISSRFYTLWSSKKIKKG